jgi:hypothetical protein
LGAFLSDAAHSYETDQHTGRGADIADSTVILNAKVNETIVEIVATWDKGHDELAVVDAFYRELGGRHWVDRLERWAMKSPDVERLDVGRYESIFADQPLYATRVAKLFGTGATIRVNSQLIGSDKIGHFISQGRKFYKRYLIFESEEMAAERSAYTERALFGQMSNGIYSNADLVANYEGHRFFRSLFEDNIIPGKPAILRWDNDSWVVQREFDWADHVNEYWDEALNINHFDAGLYKHMHETFVAMCPQYWERPELYTIVNEDALKAKYSHLQLRDTSELRLDSLCPVQASSTAIQRDSLLRQENHRRMFQHLPDALNHRCCVVAVHETVIK